MQRNGTLNFDNALDQVGEVYIPIPPNRQGAGKVMIAVQGSLKELEAITDESSIIKTGTKVKGRGYIWNKSTFNRNLYPKYSKKGDINDH